MLNHADKQFRNTATTPVILVCTASINLEGIVTRILFMGGTVQLDEITRAEAKRMRGWIRSTFVGQSHAFFVSHNGVVPAPSFAEQTNVGERDSFVERVRLFGLSGHADFLHDGDRRYAVVPTRQALWDTAPKVGSYWLDLNHRGRVFRVTSVRDGHPGCRNHLHIRMVRTDAPGRDTMIDEVFRSAEDWASRWSDMGAQRTAYDDLAEQLQGATYESAGAKFFEEFLRAVSGDVQEQPPATGERYFRADSTDKSPPVWRVVATDRVLYRKRRDVLMERESDGQRAKFRYDNHAQWLSHWRPVDDEGNARPVVEVEVEVEVPEPATLGLTERDMHAVYRELNRKVPGWNTSKTPGQAVRAIRSIWHQVQHYKGVAEMALEQGAQVPELLREVEKLKAENAQLQQQLQGGWDATRAQREQDTTREIVRLVARCEDYSFRQSGA